MELISSLPLVAWVGLAAVTLMGIVISALFMFFNGLSHYRKAVELDGLNHSIKAAEDKYAQISAEQENLRDELAKARQTISDAKTWKEWLDHHEAEFNAKKAELDRIDGDIAALKERRADLQKAVADAQTALNEAQQQRLTAQTERHNAEADAERARQEIARSNAQLQDLKDQTTKAEAELERLRRTIADLLPQEAAVKDLQRQRELLEATLKELKEKREKQEADLANLERTRQEIVRSNAQLQDLKDKTTKAEAELERLRRTIADLLQQEAAVKNLQRQRELLETVLKELKEKREKLEADLANLQGQANVAKGIIEQWRLTGEVQKDVWADLDTPVLHSPEAPRATLGDIEETEWLKRFTGQLEEGGFRFNPRLVNAFHTGLKCGDMTPLVVLAGISGTGKSLLPELYAAAAGMNFLSVPIQPRWDSPQDLFGFFNYMEGRYKATELARFLWQVDRLNNAHALADDSLSIVLLDEMNLARVEYYFSDLLSKLEQRRGLNPQVPAERAKAEIVIEGNAGSQGGARRLFVGSDVFFIGTMNEDETTQMLSDKVVDRANIMRFGKPGTMAKEPDKGALLATFAGAPRLTRTQWEAWKAANRRENAGGFDRVAREPLEELNNAFASIGRPFGHRVWQAVKSYVTHYPEMDVGGTHYDARTAFADQLEMKILPKLNGLELSAPNVRQAMGEIDGVLSALNDEGLSQAFSAAKDETANTFFKWRGVMR